MEIEKKPQTKKEWKTPELTVLVRSKPEEAVLLNCKVGIVAGPYASAGSCSSDSNCYYCELNLGS
jgi:hypothetical protein